MAERTCIGFGELDGKCDRPVDRDMNPAGLWCTECETARRKSISAQLEGITKLFRDSST